MASLESASTHLEPSEDELLELALDLTQLCLDLAGIVDPTPIRDGASMLYSLGSGRWFDAIVSGVSMLPYAGDLAKFGKTDRYLATVLDALGWARKSPWVAELLQPTLMRLNKIMALLPDALPVPLDRMRAELRLYCKPTKLAAVANALPDIRKNFRFRPRHSYGAFEAEEISGRLGIPGKVKLHNNPSAKRKVSQGTGEDAGHRIGQRFGAPCDSTNLSLQNHNINTYAPKDLQEAFLGNGASYLKMEDEWEALLQAGYKIVVKVRDRYRRGESRPFARDVEALITPPNGTAFRRTWDYGNFTSPQSRAAQGKN